jgi:hypothetical protein
VEVRIYPRSANEFAPPADQLVSCEFLSEIFANASLATGWDITVSAENTQTIDLLKWLITGSEGKCCNQASDRKISLILFLFS